ncbi:MAG: GumC family protein, partial [Bosea sp. (in: a-proteobacteria)]
MFTINQAQNEPISASVGASQVPVQSGGMSLGWLIGALWRGKLWILLLGLIGAVIGALLGGLVTPRYQSTAQLIIDPRDLRVLQNEVSPNAINNDSTTAYLESQARIIASDTVKNRVIDREKLMLDPEFGGGTSVSPLRKALESFGLAGPETAKTNPKLAALYLLDRMVTVRRGERTFVIDITATTQDPAKSARIANALATAYLDDQTEVRSEVALRASTTLNARLEELRNRLRQAEDKAERYKEANNIIGAGGKLINEDQLIQVNTELAKLRTRVAETKAKYDQTLLTRASSVEAGSVPEAVASNTMTALRAQLGAALNKEADLLASLGARHPLLAAAQQQVRDARRQISEELTRISQAAKAEYDRVRAAEKQLMDRIEDLKRGQVTASRSFVQLREIERDVESSRAIYDSFLRRARETGELVGIDTTNARIIGFAVPPQARTGISRRVLAILGGIAGLGLGTLLVLGRAWSKGPGAELLAGAGAAMRAPAPATSGQAKATAQPAAKSFRSMTSAGAAAAAAAEARAAETAPAPQANAATQPSEQASARPTWRRFGASGEPLSAS